MRNVFFLEKFMETLFCLIFFHIYTNIIKRRDLFVVLIKARKRRDQLKKNYHWNPTLCVVDEVFNREVEIKRQKRMAGSAGFISNGCITYIMLDIHSQPKTHLLTTEFEVLK